MSRADASQAFGERNRESALGAAGRATRQTNEHKTSEHALRDRGHDRDESLRDAIRRARGWLVDRQILDRQLDDGHWCGELEGDTILESEYILLLAWQGREQSDVASKAAEYLRRQQLTEGGWTQYPGGGVDVSGSVKAYFALKLVGDHAEAPHMLRARHAILRHGGADAVNSFTRFYLALLGQIPYSICPAVPPEAMLLPGWAPINIYRISAWSRTILVPLAIMWAHQPARAVDAGRGIQELFLRPPQDWPELRCPGSAHPEPWFGWERFFRWMDRALKACERARLRPLRRLSLRLAEKWMLARFVDSDGLGAIFPPIIWSLIALRCLGYADESDEVRECQSQLDALIIQDEETARLQPCKSPVWDTAITLRALAAAGCGPDDRAVARGVQWLLRKEVRTAGDWSVRVRTEPAGWFFEYRNAFYPDVDDTIMVMMALEEALALRAVRGSPRRDGVTWPRETAAPPAAETTGARDTSFVDTADIRERALEAGERARRWILAMQNRDGGWGAFDKDNDRAFLCKVPFADHNAMIDPSTPDITARVVEALAGWGMSLADAPIQRALTYLRRTQDADGSWFGRWGVNHIYGTWQVLVGLARIGIPPDDRALVAGGDWLLRVQQPCGGWGESADSYLDPHLKGRGPVTASQTAWALLGLIAAGRAGTSEVARGVQRLTDTMNADGSWEELEFTGTGFPLVFYLKYHYYSKYFPLLALATFAVQLNAQHQAIGGKTTPVSSPHSLSRFQPE